MEGDRVRPNEPCCCRSEPPSRVVRTHHFFSIMLHQAGVDPVEEVEWKVFPGDILPVALHKGEVHAFAQGDPLAWVARERDLTISAYEHAREAVAYPRGPGVPLTFAACAT